MNIYNNECAFLEMFFIVLLGVILKRYIGQNCYFGWFSMSMMFFTMSFSCVCYAT